MEIQDISSFFLIASLFIPRITLFISWLFGYLPFNTTPLIGDFFGAIFLPRVLILIWLYDINHGTSEWFWIHLVAMGFSYISSIYQWKVNIEK